MPSALATLPAFDESAKAELLHLFATLPSGRERPGRFWRINLDTIEIHPDSAAPYRAARIVAPPIRGGFACDLREAVHEHPELVARLFGSAVDVRKQKFAALAAALCNTGAFIYVPAGVDVGEPVEVEYNAQDGSLFPLTLVLLERGARCTVLERVCGKAATICGITEISAGEGAALRFACDQRTSATTRAIFTRGARAQNDASLEICVAHLGAELSVDSLDVDLMAPGANASLGALFFPTGNQHVDLTSTVVHNAGESQSQTLVKSAAAGNGQARYLGTIRIAPHAQSSEAMLRDDALLLSKHAHIDSVPALEIAANDVKAYHGATVGALDDEQIFYMTSRGIDARDAERMIALGFFEPVVERFPSQLRDEIRAELERKVGQ